MIIIKAFSRPTTIPYTNIKSSYLFGMLTDKMNEKQTKKMQEQFKKQIQHMSSKPSFTLMDYKQRILDQLNNVKGSFRKNLSKQAGQAQKRLEVEKKVLNAIFQDELVDKKKVDFTARKQIALVSGVDLKKVAEVFQKAESYRKMHKYLRSLVKSGKPLPQTMQQLQHKFQKSKYTMSKKFKRHMAHKMQNRRCEGSLRNMRLRYVSKKVYEKKRQ